MTVLANNDVLVQQQATKLRDEIQRWIDLAGQVEERANRTKDQASLGVMEAFLRSARQSIERVIEQEKSEKKQYPFMPVAESQEITLPSFPLPGKGVTVKARKGTVRLPDPVYIPQE